MPSTEIDFDAAAAAGRSLRPRRRSSDLRAPLTQVRDALVDLQQTAQDVRSPWLVNRATYELDDFDESVAEHLPGAARTRWRAIELAPEMLGADGPRTYLLLFTTPSESRGPRRLHRQLRRAHRHRRPARARRVRPRPGPRRRRRSRLAATMTGHEEFVQEFGRFGYDTDGNGAIGDAFVPQPRPDGELPVGGRDRQRAVLERRPATPSTA